MDCEDTIFFLSRFGLSFNLIILCTLISVSRSLSVHRYSHQYNQPKYKLYARNAHSAHRTMHIQFIRCIYSIAQFSVAPFRSVVQLLPHIFGSNETEPNRIKRLFLILVFYNHILR